MLATVNIKHISSHCLFVRKAEFIPAALLGVRCLRGSFHFIWVYTAWDVLFRGVGQKYVS